MAGWKAGGRSDAGPTVPPEAARQELARILQSQTFRKAERLKRLLQYLVDRTLAGDAESLKEYTVGIDAFDRPPSFDPKQDAVVRVEVRRLRSKLRDYYTTAGRDNPVRIDLPRGGYRPVLSAPGATGRLRQALESTTARLRWWHVALAAGALLAVVTGLIVAAQWHRQNRAPSVSAIAVLPFENLTGSPDNDYFCGGLTEELTATLAMIPGLRVIARTSAGQFARGHDVATIGRKLGVDAVVEGSVRRQGDTVRVTVQLIGAADQSHLWTGHYEGNGRDLLATQDEIAGAIAGVLRAGFLPESRSRSVRRHLPDPETVNLYWKGRYYRVQRTPDGRQKSIALFEQAIGRDPEYAAAHAALAEASATVAFHREGADPAGALARARRASARAIELDDGLAEPHAVVGLIKLYYDRDWPAAERAYRRAIEINPSYGQAHQMYALGLTSRGRFNEAVAQSKLALELDPMTFVITPDFGVVLYLSRRYDEAIERTRRTDLQTFSARGLLGMCYAGKGDHGAAIREFEQALALGERYSYLLGRLTFAYAAAGRGEDARRILAEIEGRIKEGTASHVHAAMAHVAVGQVSEAIEHLSTACDRHEADANFIAVEPLFDSLHRDPRFAALLGRLGLPASLLGPQAP